ncbi:MAG: single-stranded DNA-binding protein [Myxococcota bacterium]
MGTLNRVTLIGHLGADPELRYTASGAAVVNMRIATSEHWNDAKGERQERTEWHRIVVWGKSAESCSEFLRKGRSVCVEGRLQTREWNDQNQQTRYTTEIVATSVTFLGSGNNGGGREGRGSQSASNGYGQQTHQQPATGGYAHTNHQQPANNGYGQPASNGYGQPATNGYGQPATNGSYNDQDVPF